MAKLFLSGINAAGIPLLRLRLENLATAPTGALVLAGYKYFDTVVGAEMQYDGTQFRNARARADHTGTQLAATISDFTTQVQRTVWISSRPLRRTFLWADLRLRDFLCRLGLAKPLKRVGLLLRFSPLPPASPASRLSTPWPSPTRR